MPMDHVELAQLKHDLLDPDLSAILALNTTSYGRALLELANQAALMALLASASDTVAGKIEIATSAETLTGTDATRAVSPAGLQAKIDALVAAAPGVLDTLDELAAALGDDANFASTMTTALAAKASLTGVETLTNKRITERVVSTASTATLTIDMAVTDLAVITAQAAALNIANPTGSPTDGQKIAIRIKDNGTARAITYGAQIRAFGITLPTTTVINKTLYLGGRWNAADTKLDMLAVAQEA